MRKFVKKLIILGLFTFCGSLVGENINSEIDYELIANKLVNNFVEEVGDKYDLYCMGSGGSMPHDIASIKVMFMAYRKGTIKEARFLEIKTRQRLLELINSCKELRPFLREYPFPIDRVSVSISFAKSDDSRYTDGSVVLVLPAKGNIIYLKKDPKTGHYEEILKEPYEEAMKLIEAYSKQASL